MLINCPRCGFSQPQDQYCAQCGVNMQSFKPAEVSLGKKLSENLAVQIIVLLLITGVAGSYMIQSGGSPKWMQKLTTSQTGIRSTKTVSTAANPNSAAPDYSPPEGSDALAELKNQEIVVDQASATATTVPPPPPNPLTENAVAAASATRTQDVREGSTQSAAISFKLIYAEVPIETLSKWITESSQLGLYQNLQDYSAGILPDFRSRNDQFQILKTHDKKLSAGQTETFLSGTVGEDGQMIGLSTNLELKTVEGSAINGALIVTRAVRQTREAFPAEFDLNKGAAFFIVDTVTRRNFQSERAALNMAPFQVFKSPDFMAQKTKFVILLEPDLK